MRNQAYITFLLFLIAQIGWAQSSFKDCKPNEYRRIFKEAESLQERGTFIEAKNRFEAAKIYACYQRDLDAADGKIDALFEQIDRLREAAMAARHTADSALQRVIAVLDKIYFYQNKFGLSYNNRTKKYGFIDKNLYTQIQFKYDAALPFDYTGYAWVKNGASRNMKSMENGEYFLIDTSGREYLLGTLSSIKNFDSEDKILALDLRHQQLEYLRYYLGGFPNLKVLLLGDNKLRSLPTEILKLKYLRTLDLAANELNHIPEEIGGLESLESLFLHFNNLRTISEEISRLKYLKTLDLSDNQIENLPMSLLSLQKLQFLDLRNNPLSEESLLILIQLEENLPRCIIKY